MEEPSCEHNIITLRFDYDTTPDLRIRHTLDGVPNSIQRTAGILYISTSKYVCLRSSRLLFLIDLYILQTVLVVGSLGDRHFE